MFVSRLGSEFFVPLTNAGQVAFDVNLNLFSDKFIVLGLQYSANGKTYLEIQQEIFSSINLIVEFESSVE